MTALAKRALFLETEGMAIEHDDTRNVLSRQKDEAFDVIVTDVFHDVGVPYHLTTLEYAHLVKDEDLPRLVKVHREKRLPTDPEYALLPYRSIVLEYQNGERWADVHPAVQATRGFKKAW